jgi:hypothetical protein
LQAENSANAGSTYPIFGLVSGGYDQYRSALSDSGFAIADKLPETGSSRFGWATEATDQGRGMECNFAWVWRCWHALSFSCRTITLMPKAPIAPGGAAEGYGISIRADRPNMDAAREARTEAVGSLKINIAT